MHLSYIFLNISVEEHDVTTVLKTLVYDVMPSITGKLWRYLVYTDLQMEHMARIYKPEANKQCTVIIISMHCIHYIRALILNGQQLQLNMEITQPRYNTVIYQQITELCVD